MDWRRWRDRWLGDPAIRSRIARWPFGGRIAARHTRRLFSLVAGFVPAQMLAAAVELSVFDRLRDGPKPWAGLTGLPPAGAESLRQALVACGLIERRGDRVALTIDGLVVASDPALRAMIVHNRLLYADLADPVALLRGGSCGRIARFWPYAGDGDAAGYSALMTASNAMIADAVLGDLTLRAARHVMDVGGGQGAFLTALRERRGDVALTLVDLPEVVAGLDLTAQRIAVRGVAPDAPLPGGADAITLVRVLHDQDDGPAATLLARVAAALPSGGRVVVAEPMARAGADAQTAYFAAYFAAMRSGRLRSPDAVMALLRSHGFVTVGHHAPTPLVDVITGEKT